jgi:hypothetical protein
MTGIATGGRNVLAAAFSYPPGAILPGGHGASGPLERGAAAA